MGKNLGREEAQGRSPVAALENALIHVPFGSRVIRLSVPRMHGTDIKVLQHLYNASPVAEAGEVPTDGLYGSETAIAVQRLQARFEVDADGLVGPGTYYILGHLTDGYLGNGPEFGSRDLLLGDAGNDVRILQNRLVASGRRYALALGRAPDGVFDERTTQALRAYQQDIQAVNPGVPVNGAAGPETFNSLLVFAGYGGRSLRRRRKGCDVLAFQRALARAGLFDGEEDGFFGPATEAAVKRLQRQAGLLPDGVADSTVFHQLALRL